MFVQKCRIIHFNSVKLGVTMVPKDEISVQSSFSLILQKGKNSYSHQKIFLYVKLDTFMGSHVDNLSVPSLNVPNLTFLESDQDKGSHIGNNLARYHNRSHGNTHSFFP